MFDWIPNSALTFLSLGGYIIAGVFVVLGYLGMGSRDRRKESDALADTLISRLRETVDQQQKTIDATNLKLDQTTKELHQMQGRNSVLEGLFNGNEASILSFLKQAPELMRIAHENNELGKSTSQSVKVMADALTELAKHLGSPTSTTQ